MQCMEKVLSLLECVKSFVLEISRWTMLHGWVEQVNQIETLIENNQHTV